MKDTEQRIQWKKGELAEKVAIKYGDASLEKFAQEVGEDVKTVEAYRRTSRAYSEEHRHRNLSFTHYMVASYADKYDRIKKDFGSSTRLKLLDKAEENGWSTRRLRAEIANANLETEDEKILDYVGKFCGRLEQSLQSIKNETKQEITSRITRVLSQLEIDINRYE